MGQVWRARDTKLNRDVALKVLPDSFANDPDRLARLTREAQTLAALNHPNIASIYGIESHALVMELVEGEDLSQRIARGPVPLDEALPIAKQIAEALEAAHEQGIIHRDLKPANIKVRPDGTVKVLDFGLAKAMDPVGASGADAMNSPTLTAGATQMGVILGTAAYMSPEQARGKVIDKRADIWAFGVVLHEMLTGRRAFRGEDVSETLASVIKDTPDFSRLPASTPPPVRRLIERCLERDVKARLRDIGEARILLANPIESAASIATRRETRRAWMPWTLAGTFALVAIGFAAVHFREGPTENRLIRFTVAPPEKSSIGYAVLSPDGKYLAFRVTEAGGLRRLWIRSLDSLTARPLEGTEQGDRPFWSPDSRFLGFFSGKQLKKIDVTGGPVQTVTDIGVDSANGGAWSPDGTILYSLTLGAIQRVAARGGQAQPLTTLDVAHHETRHYFPSLLPDGDHFTYVVTSAEPDIRGLWMTSISHPALKQRLIPDLSEAAYSRGYLLFARGGTLMAQPFDPNRLALSGEAIPIVEHVGYSAILGFAEFSVSSTGMLSYLAQPTPWRLTWFDRSGRSLGAFGAGGSYGALGVSPDQTRVAADAASITDPHYEIYIMDSVRGTTTQLTFGAASGNFPRWSPDGTTIAFGSNRDGVYNIYQKPTSGPGHDVLLFKNGQNKFLMDWSSDGKQLLYGETDPKNGREGLWVLPMAGDRQPQPYLPPDFDYRGARFSPDGRFIAYESDEASRLQVFVQSFPAGNGKWQISTDGGDRPEWRSDGKELYYLAPGGTLMAVEVTTNPTFKVGPPKALFATWIRGALNEYGVSRDGQRFVMAAPEEGVLATPASLILNWTALVTK